MEDMYKTLLVLLLLCAATLLTVQIISVVLRFINRTRKSELEKLRRVIKAKEQIEEKHKQRIRDLENENTVAHGAYLTVSMENEDLAKKNGELMDKPVLTSFVGMRIFTSEDWGKRKTV